MTYRPIPHPFRMFSSHILNSAAIFFELVFCVPYVGRGLKWLWVIILTFVSGVLGLLDVAAWRLGYRPKKKLRVGVIILRDEEGMPLTTPEAVMPNLVKASQIFLEKANVEMVPAFFETQDHPDSDWVRTNPQPSSTRVLESACNLSALKEDLALKPGSAYEFLMTSQNFEGNFRRLTGIGSPLIVFVVRSVKEKTKNFGGCSIGPLSDYVTVTDRHLPCIAHELGHACNLLHNGTKGNIMVPDSCRQADFTPKQIMLMRASRHVSLI